MTATRTYSLHTGAAGNRHNNDSSYESVTRKCVTVRLRYVRSVCGKLQACSAPLCCAVRSNLVSARGLHMILIQRPARLVPRELTRAPPPPRALRRLSRAWESVAVCHFRPAADQRGNCLLSSCRPAARADCQGGPETPKTPPSLSVRTLREQQTQKLKLSQLY